MPDIANRIWSLVRQLQAALGGNRVIAGGVVDTGGVNYGTGFTAVKTPASTGLYTITYDVPFTSQPALSFGSDQGVPLRFSYSAATTTHVDVVVQNAGGAAMDAFFSFHAIGQ